MEASSTGSYAWLNLSLRIGGRGGYTLVLSARTVNFLVIYLLLYDWGGGVRRTVRGEFLWVSSGGQWEVLCCLAAESLREILLISSYILWKSEECLRRGVRQSFILQLQNYLLLSKPKSNQEEQSFNNKISKNAVLLYLCLNASFDVLDLDDLISPAIIFYTSSMLSIPLKRKRSASQLPYNGQQSISPSLPRLQLLSNLENELVGIIGRKNICIDDSADLFSRLQEIYMGNLQGTRIGREMLERVLRVLGEIDSPARVKFLFLYSHELAVTQQQGSQVCSNLLESFHCNLSLKEKLEVGFKAGLIYCQLCHQGSDVDRVLSNLIVSLEHELGYRPHQVKTKIVANSDSTKAIYLGSRLSHKMGNKDGGKLQKLGLFKFLFEALVIGEVRVRSEAKRRFYAEAKDQLRQRLAREYPGREIEKKLRAIQQGNWLSKIFVGFYRQQRQQKHQRQERVNYIRKSEAKVFSRSKSQVGLGSKEGSRRSSPTKGQFSSTAPTWALTNKGSSNVKLVIKKRSGSKVPRNVSEASSVEASQRPRPQMTQLVFREQSQNISKGIVLKFNKLSQHKHQVKKKAIHIPFTREKAKQNHVHQVLNICLPSVQEQKNQTLNLSPQRPSFGELTSAGRIQIDQLIKEGVEWMSGLEKEQEYKEDENNKYSNRNYSVCEFVQQKHFTIDKEKINIIVEEEVQRAVSETEEDIICHMALMMEVKQKQKEHRQKPQQNNRKTVVIALQQAQEESPQQKSDDKFSEFGILGAPSQCYSIVEQDLQSLPISNTDCNDESRLKSLRVIQRKDVEKVSQQRLAFVQNFQSYAQEQRIRQQQSTRLQVKAEVIQYQQPIQQQYIKDIDQIEITEGWIKNIADDISMCAAEDFKLDIQQETHTELVSNYMMKLFDEIERQVEIKELIAMVEMRNTEVYKQIAEESVQKQSEAVTNIPRSNSMDDSDVDSEIKSCAQQAHPPSGFATTSSQKRKSENSNIVGQLTIPKDFQQDHREREGSYFKFAGSHIDVQRSNSEWASQAFLINELSQNDRTLQQNIFCNQLIDKKRKDTIVAMLPQQNRQKQDQIRTVRSRSQSEISATNAKQNKTLRSLKKQKNNVCLSISFNDSYDAVTHSSKQFTHWLSPQIRVEKDKLSLSLVYLGKPYVRQVIVPFFVAINDDTVRQISANVQKFLLIFPSQSEGLLEQIKRQMDKIELLPEETEIQPLTVHEQSGQLTIRCIVNLKKSKITFESNRSELCLRPLITLNREDLSTEVSMLRERDLKIVDNQLRIPGVWRLLGERFIKLREKYQTSVNHLCFDVCEKQNSINSFDYFIRESSGPNFTISKLQEKQRKKVWKNIDTIIGFCIKVSKEGIRLQTASLQQFLCIL